MFNLPFKEFDEFLPEHNSEFLVLVLNDNSYMFQYELKIEKLQCTIHYEGHDAYDAGIVPMFSFDSPDEMAKIPFNKPFLRSDGINKFLSIDELKEMHMESKEKRFEPDFKKNIYFKKVWVLVNENGTQYHQDDHRLMGFIDEDELFNELIKKQQNKIISNNKLIDCDSVW